MRTTLRTLAGLAAISALIAGPPAALWQFRAAYLPDRFGDVFMWLTTRDDGSLFLLLLVGVGLVAWLQLLVAFGVEAAAALRGTHALRLPGFGWAQRLAAGVLLLLLAGTATAEAVEAPPHIVVTGDNLSSIAAAELGDADRYREVYELNRGVPQAGGGALRAPGLLKPGWVLQMPASDEVTVRPGQTLSEIARDRLGDAHRYREIFALNRDRTQPSGHSLNSPDQLRPGDVLQLPGHDPKPTLSAPPTPATVHTPATPRPVAAVPPAAPRPGEAVPAGEQDSGVTPALLAGAGGVLVASLLLLMSARRGRVRQQAVVETPSVQQLDRALRAMACNARRHGSKLPAVAGASIGANGIRLRLARTAEVIRPFTALTETEWLLSEQPSASEVDEDLAPYPALVSLGYTSESELVLANLEQAGLITLRGDLEDTGAVLAAMTWDLLSACWTSDIKIILIGTGKRTAACNADQARFAENWSEALQTVATEPCRSVIFSAEPVSHAQLGDLAALDERVAAIVTVVPDSKALPGAWSLDAGIGRTFIDELDMGVELQRLRPDQVTRLTAGHAEPGPQPEPTPSPPAVAHEDPAPAIRLLGPVSLIGVDPAAVEAKKINRLTELAAFLSLHPGANADEISRQLGTDTAPWSAATRQGYISRLRTWLGRDADGELYLPNVDARRGGYRLSDSFETDWDQFRDLSRRGLADPETSVDQLKEAMELVSGLPLSNVPSDRYAWSSWIQREMIDAVVEVAHALAAASCDAGDLTTARRAAVRGLLADPVSELLYRDLIRTEHCAGNTVAVREIGDRLRSISASLDIKLDVETTQLVTALRPG
ncbi:LysM peptidoglycan-binding domain-containing protein [Amycolatopsis sp. RTGN1]|uniref:LysM peptidoglycan-binding domain-containing protein n=1 Tax=Amycolatopsis ponsaeliensis TaxID=2992142 RepID=UPI00254E2513|nr:LysM peptidoglycan-binding domain-containing protein [Amycolatopsis sp. RTGN1]